jgi:DNA-binding IclR family transcriptional regulator
MTAETSQTLDRGLRVLEVVAESSEGLTITELASRLGIGRTVVYRLVVTLEQHALIRRGSDNRCRLGLGVLAMGRQLQPVVRDAAEPSRSDMHVTYRVGSRSPLESAAAGRAILAARTSGSRPLDPPWVVASEDGAPGVFGLAVPVLGVPGLEASVGVVSFREFDEADIGPRVARAAADIGRVLR